MTDIEMPSWAKLVDDEKAIRCPKCSSWMFNTEKPSIWECSGCKMKSYETKLEGFWIKKTNETERNDNLRELGLEPGEMYFCTKCRVHHEAGSKIGYMHLEHTGEKKKLRVCQVPECSTMLTGKQKKYGCKMNCAVFAKWKETCTKCNYHFGLKGDGYTTRKLCFSCAEKAIGATIQDWEVLGLDPTVSEKEVISAIIGIKKRGGMNEELSEAAARVIDFYQTPKRS